MAQRETDRIGAIITESLKKKGIEPHKIVLFGSFARGTPTEQSDIDILIVSRDFRNKDVFQRVKLAAGVHRELVKEFKKPFDLMYYSDVEWNRGRSLVINAAKSEGQVIYG